MSVFNRLLVTGLPAVPKPIVGRVASRYVAGEELADAVDREVAARHGRTLNADRVREALTGPQSGIVLVDDTGHTDPDDESRRLGRLSTEVAGEARAQGLDRAPDLLGQPVGVCAAIARRCDSRPKASWSSREIFHWFATFSAVRPMP